MIEQAGFTLRGRNPDVLTCIANLSNDEVFTPPEFANRMLDTLAETWAARNGGANIWADSSVTFLDPFTKSGVFLREITTRLIAGLAEEIPDLQTRVDHILTRQIFGMAITKLTSLLARRSLYCSKSANGEHSVSRGFDTESGNIWFERTEHHWENAKCSFCGAPRALFDRDPGLENHAYAFIHTNDIRARVGELFGAAMQFDVIIGNPPYQMTGGAGGSSDSSIYHLFVQQAFNLEPRFVSMVVPSRWMAGGRGLDEFRAEMLNSGHIRNLTDFPDSGTAFPGVQIKGGICYFLWDRDHSGPCDVIRIADGIEHVQKDRNLGEFDVFVRDERSIGILHAVVARGGPSMAELVSNREPFRLESNFAGFRTRPEKGDIELYRIGQSKRRVDWVARSEINKNTHLIDKWKLFVPKAYGAGESIPHQILGVPILAGPPSVCTGSYLVLSAESEEAAKSILSYYQTKFFRFMVSLRKITQDAFSHMYSWVPQQTWDRTWRDEELYNLYGLSQEQREYIESVIKPMGSDLVVDDE
jgi:site-specific DNA-methyltransferase (adenine-specific)